MAEEINAGLGPEKPKEHIRGIWAITIIVVIAILVGGGIWYWYYKTTVQDTGNLNTAKISPSASPTASASTSPSTSGSDETANWQTYSNSTYKVSIKYPTNLEYKEYTTDGASGPQTRAFGVSFYGSDKKTIIQQGQDQSELIYDVLLGVYKNTTLNQYISQGNSGNYQSVTVAGLPAKYIRTFNSELLNDYYLEYLVEKNNNVYFLTVIGDKNKDLLDKMISTLKFL